MMVSFLDLVVGFIILVVTYFVYLYLGAQKAKKDKEKKAAVKPVKQQEQKSKEDEGKLPMAIFFGSQSGTAETFATELADEARTYGFNARAVDLEDYDGDDLTKEKFVVFLMATFGEGEPTDNAANFYEWLNSEDREEGSMKGLEYAVFALGNRQYEHFCNIGRRVDTRLGELGGSRLIEHGEGDDDGSLEDDYSTWKKEFWKIARKHFNAPGADLADGPTSFTPSFTLTPRATDLPEHKGGIEWFQRTCDPKHKAEIVPVIANKELRMDTSDGGSTHHLDLDIRKNRLTYITADNLGVFPRNDYKFVARIAKRLEVRLEDVFVLKNKEGKRKLPVPSPCSVQDALLWYCDFLHTPRLNLIHTLSQYATDELEKAKLLSWCDSKKDEYTHDDKSLLEVLEECPSIKPPFVDFLEWCPKLQPRFYTISSSSMLHPRQISVTVSLATRTKPRDRVHVGICSSYMSSLRPEKDNMVVFIRSSSFRFPKKVNPVIMVGPGTGIAPFRGFLQDAKTLKEKGHPNPSSVTLYFGCRHRDKDYIYRDELMEASVQGHLTHLHIAFSREEEKKIYVQDLIVSHGERIWNALDKEKAYFFVCGGTAMGRSIREEVMKLAEKYGGIPTTKTPDYFKKLQTDGRYIQELWS